MSSERSRHCNKMASSASCVGQDAGDGSQMSILIQTLARSLLIAPVCASTQCVPKTSLPSCKMNMTEGTQAASARSRTFGRCFLGFRTLRFYSIKKCFLLTCPMSVSTSQKNQEQESVYFKL